MHGMPKPALSRGEGQPSPMPQSYQSWAWKDGRCSPCLDSARLSGWSRWVGEGGAGQDETGQSLVSCSQQPSNRGHPVCLVLRSGRGVRSCSYLLCTRQDARDMTAVVVCDAGNPSPSSAPLPPFARRWRWQRGSTKVCRGSWSQPAVDRDRGLAVR